MNEIIKNRYFFQDEFGRDAFFINVEFELDSDYHNVWTSLIIDLNKCFHYDEIERKIIQSIHDHESYSKYISELAQSIFKEKSLHRLFLPDYFLNKEGKFSYENAITIANIIDEKTEFADYTLFSESCNPLHFADFKIGLMANQLHNGFLKISYKYWLELILDHPNLQSEYVEYYSKDNEFYSLVKPSNEENTCDYFMCFEDGELRYFFNRSTKKS